MTNQEPRTSQNEKPAAGYRGGLVYRQEDGYKLITMTVSLYPNEQSHVVSHAYELPITEEAEHLSASPPLAGVDLYHFPVTDGTNIVLTVQSQEAKHTAVYSVHEAGIEEHSPFLWLDIVGASEGGEALDQEVQISHDWQAAFDEALDYYKDQIPSWLAEQDQLDTTVREPFHDTIDFSL